MESNISTRERIYISGGVSLLLLFCLTGAWVVYRAGAQKADLQRTIPAISQSSNNVNPGSATLATLANRGAPSQYMVQITALVEKNGKRVPGWTGSGVLVSEDGLILTSAQVASPGKPFPVADLLVSIQGTPDKAIAPMYYADLVQVNGLLDLAVIRITRDAQEKLLDTTALHLPFANLGDSDLLQNGDSLTILGISEKGELENQKSQVAGFKQEAGVSMRAFLQLTSDAAKSYRGGAAVDSNGNVIGILTGNEGSAGPVERKCSPTLDTNRDGIVNAEDRCPPASLPVAFARPIRIVHSLLAAAERGETHIERARASQITLPTPGKILFADPFLDMSNGWSSNDSIAIQDGKFQANVAVGYSVLTSGIAQPFGDVRIETDYEVVHSTGEGDYGALCRYTDDKNFYALEISEDGYYSIWKKEAGKFTPLVDWTSTEAVSIRAASGHLLFTCIGDTLAIMQNGQLIGQTTDESLTTGGIGLVAGTWDKGGLGISFSKFSVRSAGNQPERPLEILFQDDFSNPQSGWWDLTQGGAFFDTGLRIQVVKRQTDLFVRTYQNFSNVRMEVDATPIGGPNDNDYGMVCRYQEATHEFYYFEITSDGKYQIGYYSSDRSQIPLSNDQFKPSATILPGQALNHIRAECDGKSLILFVNGTQVALVEDTRLTEGGVGLIAGTWDTPGTDIQFDNFIVYKP
jgi:S1-C subfamily serine protease